MDDELGFVVQEGRPVMVELTDYANRLRLAQKDIDALLIEWRPEARADWRRILILYSTFVATMLDGELWRQYEHSRQDAEARYVRRHLNQMIYRLRFMAE